VSIEGIRHIAVALPSVAVAFGPIPVVTLVSGVVIGGLAIIARPRPSVRASSFSR